MDKALRYNEGKPQWSLVHYKSIEPMIRVLEYGAHKYSIFLDEFGHEITGLQVSKEEVEKRNLVLLSSGKDNWKKSMDLKKILESIQRHIASLMDGEEIDSESLISHIGHIQCNCMFYNYHKDQEKTFIKDIISIPEDDLPF